ncbi:TRAF family member-associated NF-kappa-B activator [Hippocampus comes]|uniref:TRAF family member-associated NF-kappa-B activator n=1 Tax=Hippocampus comes TaxID=109280 RepID=UPI00094EDB8F|nr:PREDICTED: TRAF family member-associated NF-kappa-B activator-like [Hippocampus comes]
MERNIGDQLNKAFEAYRQVSIEKDHAQKELQQMTEYYQQYTQELQRQIEDQQQLIGQLKAQLSATRQPSGETKCESCNHLVDGATAHGKTQHQETLSTVAPLKTVTNCVDYQDMLDALEAIHGTFRQIRSLSRRQKDHLKRFRGGMETATDQQFSMPIQCTDRAAEPEAPFFLASRSTPHIPLVPTLLASRGASPDDRDFIDSLSKFSVKFPPPVDSEYDFLNSAPERHVALTVPVKRPLSGIPAATSNEEREGEQEGEEEEEEPSELSVAFVIPTFASHTTSSSLSQEDVRGPQQVRSRSEKSSSKLSVSACSSLMEERECVKSPKCEPDTHEGRVLTLFAAEMATAQRSVPDKCAFCHAVVPQEQMNSHLYSHFSPSDETHR